MLSLADRGIRLPWSIVADFSDEDTVGDGGDDDGEGGGKQANTRIHRRDAFNCLEPDGEEINYVIELVPKT